MSPPKIFSLINKITAANIISFASQNKQTPINENKRLAEKYWRARKIKDAKAKEFPPAKNKK